MQVSGCPWSLHFQWVWGCFHPQGAARCSSNCGYHRCLQITTRGCCLINYVLNNEFLLNRRLIVLISLNWMCVYELQCFTVGMVSSHNLATREKKNSWFYLFTCIFSFFWVWWWPAAFQNAALNFGSPTFAMNTVWLQATCNSSSRLKPFHLSNRTKW